MVITTNSVAVATDKDKPNKWRLEPVQGCAGNDVVRLYRLTARQRQQFHVEPGNPGVIVVMA